MVAVKRGLSRLRAGFVLPMALVTTVITLLLVGASATYCTTQFKTSQLYLSRTRCRLVAQSAIERAKLVLMEKCGGELTGIPDPANPSFSVADTAGIINAVMTEVRKPEFTEGIPGVGPDMSVTVSVRQGTGSSRGYNFILATAEHKSGNRSATVTLQETIKIPLSSGNIFDYAYFANHDGHLTSQYMVVNGDVRANQDFYVTGAEINGYIYASNTVHLATESNKWGWWDDKDPTIRSFDSYNSTYRNGSKKELSTYAKARPTNPLSRNGREWIGGFEAVDATQVTSGNSMPSGLSPLEQFFWYLAYGRGGGTTTKTVVAPTLTAEIKPSDAVVETKETHIINAQAVHDDNTSTWGRRGENRGKEINRSPGVLKMPQIAWTDAGLKQYKDYAATAKTVSGKTGGSLSCSNCFVNAAGAVEQLSAKLKLEWTPTVDDEQLDPYKGDWLDSHAESSFLTDAESNRDYYNEETLVDDHITPDYDRSKAGQYAPKNSVLVYDCITAGEYQRKSSAEKANWRQLSGSLADPKDGVIGEFASGYKGTVSQGHAHAGAELFFGTENLKSSLMAKGFDAADAQRLVDKFNDERWAQVEYHRSPKTEKLYIDAGYEPVVGKTQWVTLYQYATSVPQVYNSKRKKWEDESGWTEISYRDPYYVKDSRCFNSEAMSAMANSLYSAYRSYYGNTWTAWQSAQAAVNAAISAAKSGWTEKKSSRTSNGYYKSSSIQGYIAFDLVRHWEEGKTDTYTVEANIVTTKSAGVQKTPEPKESSRTIYEYDSVYYSALPLGYIELAIVTNKYLETTIDVSYTPFPQLPKPDEKEVRKTLETKFVRLYEYNSSWRSPGKDWSSVSGSGFRSGYCNVAYSAGQLKNRIVKQSEVATVASQFAADYASFDPDAVAAGMLDGDWSDTSSGYYKSGTGYGYLTISLIGIYRGGDVSYEVEYAYASESDKTRIESQVPETDVMEVVYLPVHEYSERRKDGWTRIERSSTGFLNDSFRSAFNGLFMVASERDAALEGFEGSFYGAGISSDAIKRYFTSDDGEDDGWDTPESSYYGYGYYNPQVAGYMAVKVVRGVDYWNRTTYRLDYSSLVKTQEGIQDGGTGNDTVAGDCIPVYEHLSSAEWQSLAYWQKGRWTKVTKAGYSTQTHISAFESTHDDMYFSTESLNAVADYCASQDASLTAKASEVRAKILSLFTNSDGQGAKDGWEDGCTSGYIGKHPVGYLQFAVTADTHDAYDILADYAYLSVNAGEVGEKKIWNPGEKKLDSDPDYYRKNYNELSEEVRETVRERREAALSEYLEGVRRNLATPQTETKRELRRIFVKDGYHIDTTPQLYDGTGDDDLVLTRNDSGAAVDRLNAGSTTADLYPFREDGAHCNYKTKQYANSADKGAVILIGTWDYPITIDGPVVFESDVIIRGFVSGRGTIYSGRNIHIIGDINYKDPPYWPYSGGAEPNTKGKDLLVLISRGSIVFGNYVKAEADNKPMDDSWSGSDSLLSGNYINGRANSGDKTSKWGKDNAAVPYVAMDYTQNDTKGWVKYKVVYNKSNYNKPKLVLGSTPVKYYESVIGDYCFISRNNDADTAPNELSAMSTYGCSCRLAQTWDLSFAETGLRTRDNFFRYLPYQSKVLDAFAKRKGWTSADRIGLTAKTMDHLWNSYQADLWTFYTTAGSDGYGGYSGDSRSQSDVREIQDVNTVLYSSMGIFGIVGGKYSPVTVNGAIIGQDEALFPFTQYQAKRRSWWQWWKPKTTTETSQLAMTINWDIRLNLKSTESKLNQEGEEQLDSPITSDEVDSGNANMPRILSWQEVPDEFNEEYNATP